MDYLVNSALIEKLQPCSFCRNVKMKVSLKGNKLPEFDTKMIRENYRVMTK
jgi:hypothetical protein